jgi:two-component system, sensor histidine kinase RegB
MSRAPTLYRRPTGLVDPRWFTRLRWGVVGLLAVFLGASAAGIAAVGRVQWFGAALVLIAATNAILQARVRAGHPLGDGVVAGALFLDSVLFTALLAVTGGASNPLSLFFVFPVLFSAMALPPAATAGLVVVTIAQFGGLFLMPQPAAHHGHEMQGHLVGMWVAYAGAVPVLAFLVHRMRSAIDLAERQTAAAREARVAAERLSSLATLAAGAAHELATPLSTIFVASGELARATTDPRAREDLTLIREEVQRCQDVLRQLAADTGAGIGEGAESVALADLIADAIRGDGPIQVQGTPTAVIRVPRNLVVQAMRRLLGNARAASDRETPVRLDATVVDNTLVVSVTDEGDGMSEDVLARATEPFFTTRPAGAGRGLGLFFVSSVAKGLGGDLELQSVLGQGTTATLRIPGGHA